MYTSNSLHRSLELKKYFFECKYSKIFFALYLPSHGLHRRAGREAESERYRDETKTIQKKNTEPIEEDKENMLKRKVIMESDEYNEP